MRIFITAFVLWINAAAVSLAAGGRFPFTIPSVGENYMALVIPVGKDARRTSVPETQANEKVVEYDFRLEIDDWPNRQPIWSRTFTARDGAHDQSLTWGLWTQDSAYFVFLTVNPDQRRPAGYHLYAFHLTTRKLYLLDPYFGQIAVPMVGNTAPHTVDASVLDRRGRSLDEFPRKIMHVDLERLLTDKTPF